MTSNIITLIRAFGMSGMQIEDDIRRLSADSGFEIGSENVETRKRKLDNYAQFEKSIRLEAAEMSEYYEVFFCLEVSIRSLISEILFDAEGADWWDSSRVPSGIKSEVKSRQKKGIG